MACDPYKKDKLIRTLWKTFGAVPVLPIQYDLEVFSVVRREKRGGFRVIGNLSTLCENGEGKEKLERIISTQDTYTVSPDYAEITHEVTNDSSWSAKLLVFQGGGSLGMKDVRKWRIHVPSYQSTSVSSQTLLKEALFLFHPDYTNLYFPKRKPMDLWIVSDVVTVPYLKVDVLDKAGVNIGAGLGPASAPVPVEVSLAADVSGQQSFEMRGPQTGSQVRSLPVAFKGWKCRYENGMLTRYKPNRIRPDGPGNAPQALAQSVGEEGESHSNPNTDVDMQDFVEDNWFASISSPETGKV